MIDAIARQTGLVIVALLVCDEFLALNQGKTRVESREGEGAAFHLSLPGANK